MLKKIICIGLMVTALFTGKRAVGQTSQGIPVRKWQVESVEALPASVDNNKLKYFPPVISQIGGSCAQASNIGYMFTYEMNRLLDRDASEKQNRFSYLYTWNFINNGKDMGSFGVDALLFGADCGVMTEADFPRQTSPFQFYWASGYDRYFRAAHYKVENYNSIDVLNMEDIQTVKRYLYNKNEPGKPGGILTFSSQAINWKFDDNYDGPSETGYRCLLTRLATDGPHAMTITGYDDLVEFTAPDGKIHKGAFIVTNTHGSFSQDHGKFYLPYWFFLQERDNSVLSHDMIGTNVKFLKPKIVFKVGLDFTSRDDLSFKIGVSEKSTDTRPLHDYIVGIANNQGGDFQMQGPSGSSEMEFAFDFSSHIDKMEGIETPNYFLTVQNGKRGIQKGKGKMLSFAVYDYREDYDHPKVFTCDTINGHILMEGNNYFNIPTTEIPRCSYSPIKWLGQSGKPAAAPFVIKTADGKYAKVRFSDYDKKSGTIKIKYVYAPDGSRNIK